MAKVGEVHIGVVADTNGFAAGMSRAQKSLGGFRGALAGADKVLGGFGLSLGGIAKVAAPLAALELGRRAIGALGERADRGTKWVNDLADSAERMGFTANELLKIQFAADMADVSFEDFGKAAKTATIVIGDAAMGSATARAKLESLGLSVEKLRGMSKMDAVFAIGEALNKAASGAELAARGQDIFGKSFENVNNLLKQGLPGIKSLTAEMTALGLSISPAEIALLANVERSQKIAEWQSKITDARLATSFAWWTQMKSDVARWKNEQLAAFGTGVGDAGSAFKRSFTAWRDRELAEFAEGVQIVKGQQRTPRRLAPGIGGLGAPPSHGGAIPAQEGGVLGAMVGAGLRGVLDAVALREAIKTKLTLSIAGAEAGIAIGSERIASLRDKLGAMPSSIDNIPTIGATIRGSAEEYSMRVRSERMGQLDPQRKELQRMIEVEQQQLKVLQERLGKDRDDLVVIKG